MKWPGVLAVPSLPPGLARLAQRAEREARDLLHWARSGDDGMRTQIALVGAGALALVLTLMAWSFAVPLSGAVIAEATLVVDGAVKKIQHQTGGVVSELPVRDGDRVQAGDLLMRLDPTMARANLLIVTRQLDQSAGRTARLRAELDGSPAMGVSPALQARAADPDIEEMIAEETRLFESRRLVRDGQVKQLGERVQQLRDEIGGLEAQQRAKDREIAFVESELTGLRELYRKSLVQLGRVNALERESARLDGERGQLAAAVAQARGKVAETELQIIQIDRDLKAEAGRELRELQAKEAELSERAIAARDQLQRADLRSPISGVVHQLTYHTIGGVVAPGDTVMSIVPHADGLVLEAKIAPKDVDRVSAGQDAVVRLSAFDQRTTPEIPAKVVSVAPDIIEDARHDRSFYLVRVKLDSAALPGGMRLVPGMPAEVHLLTGARTAISYLLKPLSDQLSHTFRER